MNCLPPAFAPTFLPLKNYTIYRADTGRCKHVTYHATGLLSKVFFHNLKVAKILLAVQRVTRFERIVQRKSAQYVISALAKINYYNQTAECGSFKFKLFAGALGSWSKMLIFAAQLL